MYTKVLSLLSRKLVMIRDLAFSWFEANSQGLRRRKKAFSSIKRFISHKVSRRFLLVFFFLVLVFTGFSIIAGSQYPSTIISSRGNIRIYGVGVYEDRYCSYPISNLDWGTLEPGSAQNISVYVRNEGDSPATLFLVTENWTPTEASSCMDIGWNYDGREFTSMEVVEVMLTLSVSSDIGNISTFSFDIVIGIS